MGDSGINADFPIGESLSPPVIDKPIPECAEAVNVSGFVPHAVVRIFANGTEELAKENPPFGFAEITLRRSVVFGDSITATQTVGNITSLPTIDPVIVSSQLVTEIQNTKPIVGKDLFQCGRVVPTENLVPGSRVHVFEEGIEVGNQPNSGPSIAVVTRKLQAGKKVVARQVTCEGTNHEVSGPFADPVEVKPVPSPIPKPIVDTNSLIPGNDVVTLQGLLVGAAIEVFDSGTLVGQGLANNSNNYVPISQPISAGPITATQELCSNVSALSDPAVPNSQLTAPTVLAPICRNSQFVLVRGTIINAKVVVFINRRIVGYAGAAPGDVIVSLGSNRSCQIGDVITAIQYIGNIISPVSNSVTVPEVLREPAVEIIGGEPFFLPKGTEQPIEGPVFPRGRGPGPIVKVQACCRKDVEISILDPNGQVIDKPILTEVVPGYWTATWAWTPFSNSSQIPVGKYMVTARSACTEIEANIPFYIIFNPADVGGPPRFSFDDTAVWFGTSTNSIVGLHYFLHLSDMRVFSKAINAISGQVDSYKAAILVARLEEQLFGYSLDYHTNDVVDLITKFTEAQCADDASCLTALLRASGIPAHNVTADAGLETGAANWTFDTWVEFLASNEGITEWRIFHPHEYPGMNPESRATFGTSRGVATKSFNDLIVMANENWIFAELDDSRVDVTYSRNSCREPEQAITKAPWIDELCESGYWSQPHWDCAGVTARSFRAVPGLRTANSPLTFGSTATGVLHLVNTFGNRRFGTVFVELVSSIPESKKFPDASYDTTNVQVTLDHKGSFTVPYNLKIPQTLPPNHRLYIWAHLNGYTMQLNEIRIPPAVEFNLIEQQNLCFSLSKKYILRGILTNTGNTPISSIDVNLKVPFAIQVVNANQKLDILQSRESREISWQIRAISPLTSGSLRFSVSTLSAGSTVLNRAFRIDGPKLTVQAIPATIL